MQANEAGRETALQRELIGAGLAGGVLLVAMSSAFRVTADAAHAGQWLLQSLLLWSFVWRQTWQRRDLNRPAAGARPYARFGAANRLTLLRGGLIAAAGGFLFQPQYAGLSGWLPAMLYSLAAILDRVDGYVARRLRQTSLLGNELDTVFDALGLLVAPLLALGYGKIHWSYLLVSVAYYLFTGGLHWRRRQGLPVYPLEPNELRRSLAGFQMGLIAVLLWPPFQAELTRLIGVAFMLPLLVGFVVDWQVVSGRITPRAPATARRFHTLAAWRDWVLLPGLRVLLAATLWQLLHFSGAPLAPVSSVPEMLLAWVLLLGTAMVAIGLAGQTAALVLLLLLAWQSPDGHGGMGLYVVVFSAVGILLLGTGRFSLWQGDGQWINRHDGA